jgi:hypothetical protein
MTNLIRVTSKKGPVYINPAFISRISVANGPYSKTVIEIANNHYSTWCDESPQQVLQLIQEAQNHQLEPQ